jgi:UDP-glucose 6-dehydrogenase
MQSAVNTVKRVVCVGAGYVGGSTMPIIASHAPDLTVTIVDIDEKRINEWNSGKLPIYEPGLEEIVRAHINKNLFFTTRDLPKAIKEADVIFIAVNTGTKEYGHGAGSAYDLTSWEAVSRSIAKYATEERFYVIVEKSTVPVRTAEQVRRILDASKAPGTPSISLPPLRIFYIFYILLAIAASTQFSFFYFELHSIPLPSTRHLGADPKPAMVVCRCGD